MTGTSDVVARVDPGRLTKILLLKNTGELRSPVMRDCVWRSPILRADDFCASAQVAEAPGIHAYRFGYCAAPLTPDVVLAICRVPPGTRAVMSPWAVRAEALLIEQLIVHPYLHDHPLYHQLRRLWAPHCDIAPARRGGDYKGMGEPPIFRLWSRDGRTSVRLEAGRMMVAGPYDRLLEVEAHERHGIQAVRYYGLGHCRILRGPRVRARLERAIRRAYDAGSPALRDALTPWLRYLHYIA